MQVNRQILLLFLLLLNFLGISVLGYAAYTYLQNSAEELYKVKIKTSVDYTPIFGGFSVKKVDVEIADEGIGGFFRRKPMSLLRFDNVLVRAMLLDESQTVCREEIFTSFSRIGETKSFEFECRRVPRGIYTLQVVVLHNDEIKAQYKTSISVGVGN